MMEARDYLTPDELAVEKEDKTEQQPHTGPQLSVIAGETAIEQQYPPEPTETGEPVPPSQLLDTPPELFDTIVSTETPPFSEHPAPATPPIPDIDIEPASPPAAAP